MAYGCRGRATRGTRGGRPAAVVGVILAGTLVLSACGSDDGEDAETSTAPASATTGAQQSGDPSAAEHPRNPDDPGNPGDPENPGDASAPEAPADPASEGGGPASGEDEAQISELARGMSGDKLLSETYQYMLDNHCSAFIDAQGGRETIQATIDGLRSDNDQLLSESGGVIEVTDVRDVRVDGDNGSAFIVGTAGGQDASSTQNYLRENGAWKICPAA